MQMDQGFWTGVAITFGVLLINSEEPGWRIAILVGMGWAVLRIVLKSEWVRRTNQILTLTGEPYADDGDTASRKLAAYSYVILGIAVFGFVTWPSRQIGVPGDGDLFYNPAESHLQYQPTPKGILPKEPDVQPKAESKVGTGHVVGTLVKNVKPPAVRPTAPGPPGNVVATVQ